MENEKSAWRKAKLASLDRTQRMILRFMFPLETALGISCAFYIGSFLRFNFLYDPSTSLFWLDFIQLCGVILSVLAIVILPGIVIALNIVHRRIEQQSVECRHRST